MLHIAVFWILVKLCVSKDFLKPVFRKNVTLLNKRLTYLQSISLFRINRKVLPSFIFLILSLEDGPQGFDWKFKYLGQSLLGWCLKKGMGISSNKVFRWTNLYHWISSVDRFWLYWGALSFSKHASPNGKKWWKRCDRNWQVGVSNPKDCRENQTKAGIDPGSFMTRIQGLTTGPQYYSYELVIYLTSSFLLSLSLLHIWFLKMNIFQVSEAVFCFSD